MRVYFSVNKKHEAHASSESVTTVTTVSPPLICRACTATRQRGTQSIESTFRSSGTNAASVALVVLVRSSSRYGHKRVYWRAALAFDGEIRSIFVLVADRVCADENAPREAGARVRDRVLQRHERVRHPRVALKQAAVVL